MSIESEALIGNKKLSLVRGDITERDVDAIVNAANRYLRHGGGVAGAIVRKGGAVIQKESDEIGFTPVGTAAITSAGRLPSKFVVHAVGPRMGEGDEDLKLKNALLNSLRLASERGLESISIPAISSGIYGFPKDRCAEILVRGAAAFLGLNPDSSLRHVEFCILDEDTLGFFRREFDRLDAEIK